MVEEVELDIASILKEYNRMDREITDRGRDFIAERGLPYNQLFKIKPNWHQSAIWNRRRRC